MAGLLPPVKDIGVMRAPVRSCLFLAGLFFAALLCLTLLGRLGLFPDRISQAVILAAFLVAALVGLSAHGLRPVDFYIADRNVPAALNGMAAATAFLGFVVVEIAGGVTANAVLIPQVAGLLAGYWLLAVFFAPNLRRFGGYGVPDYLAWRFGGTATRLLGAAVVFACSTILLVALLAVAGPLISGFLGLDPTIATAVAAAAMAFTVLPGGMRSLTWTQIVYFFLIAAGCLIPAALLSAGGAGAAAPVIATGAGLAALLLPIMEPFAGDAAGWGMTLFLFAAGVAALPQLLQRALTAESPGAAAGSMIWSILFVMMLATAALVFASSAGIWSAAGASAPVPLATDLPPVVIGLVLAALLAALFASGQAALVAAAGTISHDLWDSVIDRRGPAGRRVLVARLAIIAVAAGAARLAAMAGVNPASLVAWALALAAAANFAPVLLGIVWRRCNATGALCGMGGGFAVVAVLFAADQGRLPGTMDSALALAPAGAALLGMSVALLGAVGGSVLTAVRVSQRSGRNKRFGRGEPQVQERPA